MRKLKIFATLILFMTLAWKRLDLERLRWPILGMLATLTVAAVLNATGSVSPEHGLIVLLGVVLIAAWWGGFGTGITATIAALMVTAYVMPPINSFRIASTRDAIYLSLAAVQGLLISQLCGRLRRHRLAHRAMLADLVEVTRRANCDRRRLADLQDDVQQLSTAVALRLRPAIEGAEPAAAVAFANALEDYSRIQAPFHGEPVPSGRVLTAAIRAVAPAPTIRFEIPDDLPAVEMREADLLRVFTEVLSNAVRLQSADSPVVQVQCVRQRNCWVFSISDTGPGMIPLRASRAFVLFGGDDPQHMGVGLAISRRIVRAYGGEMWIESRQALGATVHFTVR